MKKLTAAVLMLALLLTLSGCGAVRAVQKLDAAEDRIEKKLDAAEEKLEDTLRNAVVPAPAQDSRKTQPAVPEQSRLLTEEQAVKIALDYLELTSDLVTGLRTEYEIDDGIPQYDVQFHQGDWEYEFEIHGETGKILSCDKDHRYD